MASLNHAIRDYQDSLGMQKDMDDLVDIVINGGGCAMDPYGPVTIVNNRVIWPTDCTSNAMLDDYDYSMFISELELIIDRDNEHPQQIVLLDMMGHDIVCKITNNKLSDESMPIQLHNSLYFITFDSQSENLHHFKKSFQLAINRFEYVNQCFERKRLNLFLPGPEENYLEQKHLDHFDVIFLALA